MAVLEILTYPDPRLRTKAKPVETVTDAHRQILKDMLETMRSDNGVGLAATQVNIHERMVVMDVSSSRQEVRYFINPEILSQSGEVEMEEGCLSVPEIFAKVSRAETVQLKYLDEHGQSHEETLTGYEAKCIQHEIDHLNGVLFVDRLSPLKRKMLDNKLQKLIKKK